MACEELDALRVGGSAIEMKMAQARIRELMEAKPEKAIAMRECFASCFEFARECLLVAHDAASRLGDDYLVSRVVELNGKLGK